MLLYKYIDINTSFYQFYGFITIDFIQLFKKSDYTS